MQIEDNKSLGEEATLQGVTSTSVDELSLGAQSTFDRSDVSSLPDHDMEIVDLSKRYRIEKSLGRGGMGEVLLATDTRLDRQVAIKRIRADVAVGKTGTARFLTEAKAVAALSHNNVVGVYDFGRDADGPFLIMEYVSGGSLLQRCKQGPIELEEVVELACQLCDGLGRAHDAGIIHRDIKPANILLTADGTPKLTDFGLAKADSRDHTMTMVGAVLGTLDFMPPEQRQGASLTDSRSDLWSLAATLYQMVTGESPKVIRLKRVPEQIREVMDKALEESKDERFQTSLELRDALRDSVDRNSPSRSVSIQNLDEGQCFSCGSRNPSSRKFCKECAAPLLVSCLKCEEVIPVWDKVCGECGCLQEDILADLRQKMTSRRTQAEECLQDLDFDAARKIATEIQDESDVRLSHLKSWSKGFHEEINATWDREKQRASELLSEAIKHESAKDYAAAIRVLEQVADVIRNQNLDGHDETVSTAKRRIVAIQRRLEEIEQQKNHAEQLVGDHRYEGALAVAKEVLAIEDDRFSQYRKWAEEFIKSTSLERERQNESAHQIYSEAKEHREDFDCNSAIQSLESIPEPIRTSDVNQFLSKLKSDRDESLALMEIIRDGIANRKLDGLLAKLERALELQGHTEALKMLNQQLVELPEHRARQIEEAKKHHAAYDYNSAIHAIESIPEPMRSSEDNQYLSKLKSNREESYTLMQIIRASLGNHNLDELLLKVERALELQGNRGDLVKIQKQLHERYAKHLFSLASKLLAQGQAKEAAAMIDKVRAPSLTPQQAKIKKELAEIVRSENELFATLKESRADGLIDSREVFELLPKAKSYLKLNPKQAAVQKLHSDLLDRLKKLPASDLANLPASVLEVLPLSSLADMPASYVLSLPPLTNSIGMKLKLLPAGSIAMRIESGHSTEPRTQRVTLTKCYEIGVFEVTQAQYDRVMGANPSRFKGSSNPVEKVSWYEAVAFCEKLSSLPSEREAGRVYRLPTEAEWEYACRAGTTTEYSFGDEESSLVYYAWYKSNSVSTTYPVGLKKPNPWGLYDMHGNVWEWCSNWYEDNIDGFVTDPAGTSDGSSRVIRGGSWLSTAHLCRAAYRSDDCPLARNSYVGFRVACVPFGQ